MDKEKKIRIIAEAVDRASTKFEKIEDNAKESAKAAENSFQQAGKKLKAFGSRASAVGGRLTAGVTLPIAAAGGAAAKMAGDFDRSFSKMRGLVGVADDQIKTFRKHILSLSKEVAKSPKELADAMFFITSSGLRGKNAMEALTASAKSAKAGLGKTSNVANTVTAAMNAYGSETLSAKRATDVLTATIRKGQMRTDALAQSIGQVIPVSSKMGVSFNQVGAAIATMTRKGAKAPRAVTAVQRMMTSLMKTTKKQRENFQKLGLSVEWLKNQFSEEGLLKPLRELKKRAEENDVEMAQLFRRMRALRGVMQLTTGDVEKAAGIFKDMENVTGMTGEAFETVANDQLFALEDALNRLRLAAVKVGSKALPSLIPMIKSLGKAVSGVVGWFADLEPVTQRFIIGMTGMTAAAGPLILVLGQVATAVGALATAFSGLAATVTVATGGLTALGAILAGGFAFASYTSGIEDAKDATDKYSSSLEKARERNKGLIRSIRQKRKEMNKTSKQSLGSNISKLNAAISKQKANIDSVKSSVEELRERKKELNEEIEQPTEGTTTETITTDFGRQYQIERPVGESEARQKAKKQLKEINTKLASKNEHLSKSEERLKNLTNQRKKLKEELKGMGDDGGDVATGTETGGGVEKQKKLLEEYNQKYFELTHNRIEILRREQEQKIKQTNKGSKARARINKFYNTKIRKMKEKQARKWQKKYLELTDQRVEALKMEKQQAIKQAEQGSKRRARIKKFYEKKITQVKQQEQQKREKFEEKWNRKYLQMTDQRVKLLKKEKQEALQQARELGAKKAKIKMYYNRKIQQAQKRHSNKISMQAKRAFETFGITAESTMKELRRISNSFKQNFVNSLTKMTQTGKFKWKNMVDSMLQQLQRLATQKLVADPLFSAISSGLSSYFGGVDTSGRQPLNIDLSDLSTKASGGPVSRGENYIVGEEGPELFSPGKSGNITPNDELGRKGGGGGNKTVINQTIEITTGVQQTVRAEIQNLMPEIQSKSKAAVMEAISRGGSAAQTVQGA